MSEQKPRPTVDELYELIKRSNLPTVLVEGKNDIIYYREIEDTLRDLGIDMLPAGNKDAVIRLRNKIKDNKIQIPIAYVVDNDLWVHDLGFSDSDHSDLITTEGYSIENDLIRDGEIMKLMNASEMGKFSAELERFCHWYALAIQRHLNGEINCFRTHPGKVLDDPDHYKRNTSLKEGEKYPDEFYNNIVKNFDRLLRGKSLFGMIHRQLSRKGRPVKFSENQLMAFGASRKGPFYQRICEAISQKIKSCPKV